MVIYVPPTTLLFPKQYIYTCQYHTSTRCINSGQGLHIIVINIKIFPQYEDNCNYNSMKIIVNAIIVNNHIVQHTFSQRMFMMESQRYSTELVLCHTVRSLYCRR